MWTWLKFNSIRPADGIGDNWNAKSRICDLMATTA